MLIKHIVYKILEKSAQTIVPGIGQNRLHRNCTGMDKLWSERENYPWESLQDSTLSTFHGPKVIKTEVSM